MIRLKRALSAVLAILLTYGLFAGLTVNAATIPVNMYVDEYTTGTLNFHWDSMPGVQSAVITYHVPDDTDNAVENILELNQTTNEASVSGLKSDYIYDIRLELYSQEDGAGELLGEGLLFYLPKITFFAGAVAPDPAYTDIDGGGRESGDKPELKLRWIEPKVYNGVKFVFVTHVPDIGDIDGDLDTTELIYTQANLTYMETQLNNVYNDGRELDFLNYRVNISSDLTRLNGGSSQAAIIINDNGGAPRANVSTSDPTPDVTSAVYGIDTNGYYSFNLVGRKDETVPNAPDDNAGDERLPDNDILPGSVYYMNIKPVFADSDNSPVNAVTSANPEDQNGSLLMGTVSYASTPVRFQLSKDNANNIYIKIYKINQGSLDLPRLYYQVQASDDPSVPGDWTVKKTMDDTYFNGDFAVTAISGVNPNNNIYYKIVVKSDSPNDKLESLKMPYMLSVDTSKPPVPLSIVVTGRELHAGTVVNPSSADVNVKSTDVTISWDKPTNWDTEYDDLVFHFMLSTSQTDLTDEVPFYVNGTYWDNYVPEYRLVKYVDGRSESIIDDGNRLSLTIDAFDLFKAEKWNDLIDDIDIVDLNNPDDNPDDYPAFLAPNTVYYFKMYTTKASDAGTTDPSKMSDQSLVVSFTTLNGVELDVPLPANLGLEANGKNTEISPPVNYIDIVFDKVTNLDWRNYTSNYNTTDYNYYTYYDIYMNSRTDTGFTLIGTTEEQDADLIFTGVDDPASTSVKARISQFTDNSNQVISRFGTRLLPNTTYYFMAQTRLVMQSKADPADLVEKISAGTAILPVTTIVIDMNPPDDNDRKPLTPVDFAIANDSGGNQLLTGNSVTFTWERKEFDVVYELVRTAGRVNPTDQLSTYEFDAEYISFLDAYDLPGDGLPNNKVYLDPDPDADPAAGPEGKFTYDSATKMCTYTVDMRLFPNKLYYFSLKAVRLNNQNISVAESAWTSIPVTTSLIEAPAQLASVIDAQLGFFWIDSTSGMTAEDYRIFVKGPGDSAYKLVTRSASSIVKDRDGRTYYGRIMNLKVNSSYDIRVFKGVDNNVMVYEKIGMKTRDGYHELEVKWRGLPFDDYSYYEIAIRAEDASEYTILTASDLERYTEKGGDLLSYYTEETSQTAGNDYMFFNARIKSAVVTLPGGLQTRQPLRSNVKYYIKVRAVRIDPADAALVSYSKYVGPVDLRTEFNQDDYDNTDGENENKATFLEKMEQLEKGCYWRVDIGNSDAVQILLKGEMVVNAINNSSEASFTLDMSELSLNMDKDVIYMPLSVVKAINAKNKSLIIKTNGAEYVLRPRSLDAAENQQINDLIQRPAVKDLYLQLTIVRTDTAPASLSSSGERISAVNDLEIQAVGASKTDSELKDLFYDKLYNEEDGLVSAKLNLLLNAYVGNGSNASKTMNEYTAKLIGMIEEELSEYINSTLESVKLKTSVQIITQFGTPVSARLSFSSRQGLKTPYVLYDGTDTWQKPSANVVQAPSSLTFNVLKTGKYVILLAQSSISDVPDSHWAREYIGKLTSKYDLSDVFTGINTAFAPENQVSGKEIILLYEKVTGRTAANTGLDIKQRSAKLGLDAIINPNAVLKNIKRQETAAVLIKLFAVNKGVSGTALRPGGTIMLNDEADVSDIFYSSVIMTVDLNLMETDSSLNFKPLAFMTRAEVAAAFVRLLELTGDI